MLSGPHISFSSVDQFLSRGNESVPPKSFAIKLDSLGERSLELRFERLPKGGVKVAEMNYRLEETSVTLRPSMKGEK